MVTSDDRVAEMIEVAVSASGDANLDLLVTPIENASPDYIKWAKNQTIEQDQTDAFYNVDPFANSTPIASERVAGMRDYKKTNLSNPSR